MITVAKTPNIFSQCVDERCVRHPVYTCMHIYIQASHWNASQSRDDFHGDNPGRLFHDARNNFKRLEKSIWASESTSTRNFSPYIPEPLIILVYLRDASSSCGFTCVHYLSFARCIAAQTNLRETITERARTFAFLYRSRRRNSVSRYCS